MVETAEPQGPIHNPFPIADQSVDIAYTAVFHEYVRGQVSGNLSSVDGEFYRMEHEGNQLLCHRIFDIASFFPNDPSWTMPYIVGAAVGYRMIREEVQIRGGKVPILSQETLDTSEDDDLDIEFHREEFYGPDAKPTFQDQTRKTLVNRIGFRVAEFFNQEPAVKEYFSLLWEAGDQTDRAVVLGIHSMWRYFKTNAESQKLRALMQAGEEPGLTP